MKSLLAALLLMPTAAAEEAPPPISLATPWAPGLYRVRARLHEERRKAGYENRFTIRFGENDEVAFEELFRHLGLSVDWTRTYATIDDHYRRVSQLAFLENLARDEAYQVDAPSLWDVSFQTAVAQAEVVEIARIMVQRGDALIVAGNHEFNAIAFATPRRNGEGYCRPHIDKNRKQPASGTHSRARKSSRH